MARTKRRWTVEHEWTCSACKKKNLGRSLSCSSCGKPKGGEKYDERGAETKPAVTDARVLAESRRGRNWSCSFCDYENRGDEKKCGKCGAPRISPRTQEIQERLRETTDILTGGEDDGSEMELFRQLLRPETPSKTVQKADLPPDVAEAFDSGVMTNEQMGILLNGQMGDVYGARLETKRTFTGGDYRTAPKVEVEPILPTTPVSPVYPEEDEDEPTPRWDEGQKRKWAIGTAVALGVSAIVGGIVWFFTPWNENVHVEARSWTRSVELQERTTLSGEGWDGDEPSGHFNDVCETRQHGTHDCNPYDCHPHSVDCRCHQVETGESCHTSCTSGSNGFSECEESCSPTYSEECDTCTEYDTCYEQCPTYDQWCRYNYYEWPTIRTERTSGSGDDPVVWPSLSVDPRAANPQRVVPHETYRVVFRNDSGDWTYEPAGEGDYMRFDLREAWVIEVNHAGNVRPLHEGP